MTSAPIESDSRLPAWADGVLADAFATYAGGRIISLAPTWRNEEPTRYTLALFSAEPSCPQLLHFFRLAHQLALPNPRPISAPTLRLASLFHPLFYTRFVGRGGPAVGVGMYRLRMAPRTDVNVPTLRYYLQSLLFLAGCTLSAAVVQDRFGEATIVSKLTRLWQAAQYVRRFRLAGLDPDAIEAFVVTHADVDGRSSYERLIAIKKEYGRVLRALEYPTMGTVQQLPTARLSAAERARFGFVPDLRRRLGANLRAIVVYGSSVTSQRFADYDLLIVVDREGEALRAMAGAQPTYQGVEINCGIYDTEDFLTFQAMSGDNLDINARCVYGTTDVLLKPTEDLMARNFSFAFVRLRQLLGMAGYLSRYGVHPDLGPQSNLYEYLVKIPAHIMKGVKQAVGESVDKDQLNAWTTGELGYDVTAQLAAIRNRRADQAIAKAYLATHGVIAHLNHKYEVYEDAPAGSEGVRRHGEPPAGPIAEVTA